jgi:hypothetical protein
MGFFGQSRKGKFALGNAAGLAEYVSSGGLAIPGLTWPGFDPFDPGFDPEFDPGTRDPPGRAKDGLRLGPAPDSIPRT